MASAAKMEEILGTAESQEINIFPIIVKLTFDALYGNYITTFAVELTSIVNESNKSIKM
jgi:hypothetical protein